MRHAVSVSGTVHLAPPLLARTHRVPADPGLPEGDDAAVGGRGVPDGVVPTGPANLEVATACAGEDGSRKEKRSRVGRRG